MSNEKQRLISSGSEIFKDYSDNNFAESEKHWPEPVLCNAAEAEVQISKTWREREKTFEDKSNWPKPVLYNAAEAEVDASSKWRKRESEFAENLSFEYNDKLSDDSSEKGSITRNAEVSFVIKLLVVFACLVSILISMGFGYSLSVLYAQLIRVFDAERSLVALNQSFYEALLAVGGALWSFPVSKIGYGNCIVIGGIVGSVCVSFSSLALNVPTIIILVGIMSGASFGIVYMGPFVVAGDIFDKHKEAVIGFVSIGSSLGQFTMSYFMEICIEEYNWNGALMVLGAICLNAVPCGMLMVIAHKRSTNATSKVTASAKRSLFKLSLFKEKLFWLLLLNSVILAFTALAESRFIVDLVELKGFERQIGSFFVTMIGISNLIGGLMGSVSKVMCKVSSATHMGYWLLITAVSHGLVVYVDTYAGLLAASLINGLCIGNIYAHVAVALYEIYGTEDYAPSFATWNVMKGVGNFLGGYFGGFTSDTTGNYDLLFQISIILSIFYSLSFFGIVIYRRLKARQNGYTKI